ncbi:MAG: hypothetical protein ACLP0J_21655 [Solirubrobacteraceae bacterium]
MSSARVQSGARRSASGLARLARAWRQLTSEQRLAAAAALGLFVTLFLPWYQESVITGTSSKVKGLIMASESLNGWQAFSWVEAAVLLVAVAVLVLLFERAEGRAFHLPGGDGSVITAAGGWTSVLVVWRIFDKEGTSNAHVYATTSGIDWGIFIALGVAGLLTYAGTCIRASRQPEPPLASEDGAVFDGHWHSSSRDPQAPNARDPQAPSSREPQAPNARDPQEDPTARNAGPRAPRERVPERSSWRPAEKPEWSEPKRPVGWLTAPPASGARRSDQAVTQRLPPVEARDLAGRDEVEADQTDHDDPGEDQRP